MTLDEAGDAFEALQNKETATAFAVALIDYYVDDMIGPDTLREGFIKIADYLTDGVNSLGWPVTTRVIPT